MLHRVHHKGRPSVEEIVLDLDAAIHQLAKTQAMGGQRYITFFLGAIDLRTGELTYVNAGHPEALLQAVRPPALLPKARQRHQPARLPPPQGATRSKWAGRSSSPATSSSSTPTEPPSCSAKASTARAWTCSKPAWSAACLEHPEAMVAHIAEVLDRHLGGRAAPDDTTWMALRLREKS